MGGIRQWIVVLSFWEFMNRMCSSCCHFVCKWQSDDTPSGLHFEKKCKSDDTSSDRHSKKWVSVWARECCTSSSPLPISFCLQSLQTWGETRCSKAMPMLQVMEELLGTLASCASFNRSWAWWNLEAPNRKSGWNSSWCGSHENARKEACKEVDGEVDGEILEGGWVNLQERELLASKIRNSMWNLR